MRIALGAIALNLVASLILHVSPRAASTDAALCPGPIAAFGPALAVVVLVVADPSFRSYLLRPIAHKKTWARILATALALLLLSLLIFDWHISDPTGELEGASMFWGHPLAWIRTGYFYAGFVGEAIRSQGGYAYIFAQPWYTNPVVLLNHLVFDASFFFTYSALVVHVLQSRASKASSSQ